MKNFYFANSVLFKMQDVLIAVALTAAIVPSKAQTVISNNDNIGRVPKIFSYDGKSKMVEFDKKQDQSNTCLKIYDENLLQVKQLEIPAYLYLKQEDQERVVIEGEYEEIINSKDNILSDVTLDEAIGIASSDGFIEHLIENGVHSFYNPQDGAHSLSEGEDYRNCIKYVYDTSSKSLYRYEYFLTRKYSDWKTVDVRNYYGNNMEACYVYNFDELYDGADLSVTQTLFNSDDKYEYIRGNADLSSEPDVNETDWVWLGNEQFPVKRTLTWNSNIKSYSVVSETGEVLYTFPGNYIDLFLIGSKKYLSLSDNNDGTATLYEIDGLRNSVKEISASALNIFPRSVRRNETVTVETGEETVNEKREIVVTSTDGSVMERRSIPAGEKGIQMGTSRLSAGVYNFTVYSKGKRVDNGKIVVR